MNDDVYTLPEGDITLQWPKTLTPDGYAELEDWLELIKRKAKRAIKNPEDVSELLCRDGYSQLALGEAAISMARHSRI